MIGAIALDESAIPENVNQARRIIKESRICRANISVGAPITLWPAYLQAMPNTLYKVSRS
jgi:hypothetical protein